jgi:xanthine dehydrogenase accessory factor
LWFNLGMTNPILLRGGGDLASGVALRLRHAGFEVIISELPQPLAVRRTVAFAEAVYAGQISVEDIQARLAGSTAEAFAFAGDGIIAVLVDPQAVILNEGSFAALVDARLTKQPPDTTLSSALLTIGLGPGFTAGENVHAVVETQRGHTLGRVYWQGSASADSGQPEGDPRRVLRAPTGGMVVARAEIGTHIEAGQVIAEISGQAVVAPFKGVLRGLIHPGIEVPAGMKIGDIDPRDNPAYCYLVSDKALSIGGGVLEAIMARKDLYPPS